MIIASFLKHTFVQAFIHRFYTFFLLESNFEKTVADMCTM